MANEVRFDSMRVRNVLSHEDSKIDFGEKLTVICGDSEGGKTTLLRAMRLACENMPSGTDLLRHGAGRGECAETTVSATNKADGAAVSVMRRRRDSSKVNEYVINGGTTLKAFGVGTPVEIADLLNLSPFAFQLQQKPHFLLCENDGEVARILGHAVGQGEIDAAFAAIRVKKTANDLELRVAEADVKRESAALAVYDGLDEAARLAGEAADAEAERAATERLRDAVSIAASVLRAIPPDAGDAVRLADAAVRGLADSASECDAVRSVFEGCSAIVLAVSVLPDVTKALVGANVAVSKLASALAERDAVAAEFAAASRIVRGLDSLAPDAVASLVEALAAVDGAAVLFAERERVREEFDDLRGMCSAIAALPECLDAGRIADALGAVEAYAVAQDALQDAVSFTVGLSSRIGALAAAEKACAGSEADVARCRTALDVYVASHPVCPECGSERQHWHIED